MSRLESGDGRKLFFRFGARFVQKNEILPCAGALPRENFRRSDKNFASSVGFQDIVHHQTGSDDASVPEFHIGKFPRRNETLIQSPAFFVFDGESGSGLFRRDTAFGNGAVMNFRFPFPQRENDFKNTVVILGI